MDTRKARSVVWNGQILFSQEIALYFQWHIVVLTSKDSKNQTNRLFHFCTLLLQTDSINQHLTKEKCTKNKAV